MKSTAGRAKIGIGLARLLPIFALGLWAFTIQPAVADDTIQARSKVTKPGCPELEAGQASTDKGDSGQKAGAAMGSGGFRAYRDPETGRLGVPPPKTGAAQPPEPGVASSTTAEEFVETPSPVPGGGVAVGLKGRFRSSLTATVEPDGKVTIQHGPCDTGPDPKR